MDRRELLVRWLNDAYSMEKSLVPVLRNHADDAREYPDVRERDLRHMEETQRHAQLVEESLRSMGERPSGVKSMLGTMMGNLQAQSTEPFRDELMKNFLSDYAVEQFEIASYKSLITAARELGEEDVARRCEQILRDEEEMARWLDENMSSAVRRTFGQVE